MANKVVYADPRRFFIDTDAQVIAINVGEQGYYPIFCKCSADALNSTNVTHEIVESAVAGSMFGWDCPAARAAVQYAEGYESCVSQ
jgi:hypothetical protein